MLETVARIESAVESFLKHLSLPQSCSDGTPPLRKPNSIFSKEVPYALNENNPRDLRPRRR